MEDRLRHIVGGIGHVELGLSQAVVLEISLEEGRGRRDPFLRAHLPVDQAGVRTGLARQLPPDAAALQHGRRPPAVGPAESARQHLKPFVLVGSAHVGRGIVLQAQAADARRDIRRGRADQLIAVPLGSREPVLRQPLRVEDAVAQAQNGWHELREAGSDHECVVAEPPPADALGQDVPGFRPTEPVL